MAIENKDKYAFEHDSTELDRLTDQHQYVKDAMGGRLVLAPIDLSEPGMRILDSATADGYWLIDLKSSLDASHEYVGTDIAPHWFPSDLPPSLTLTIQSITKPWPQEMRDSFNLVHQRFAFPAAGKFPVRDVVMNLIGLVKPGGWIQLIETDHGSGAEDTSTAMGRFGQLTKEVFGIMGVDHKEALRIQGWFHDAGLEDIEERVVEVQLGARNRNPDMAAKSVRNVFNVVKGLSQHAKAISKQFTSEELDLMAPQISEELANVGGTQRIHVVWGRKPYASTNGVQ